MKLSFPGFVDLHVNGFAGVDFNTPGCSAEQLQYAGHILKTTGVTRYLPTLITSSFERFAQCAKPFRDLNDPAIVGLHMEGPYISGVDGARGAHPRDHVAPASIEDFKRRQEAAGGRIVLVTLAPEASGAIKLIEYLATTPVRIAIGHTLAGREELRDAIQAGATMSTHLGNACQQMLHRHHNVLWEQLAADGLLASLIADGHHLPASVLKTMVRAKTPSRVILVSDAVSAACSPTLDHKLGDLDIHLSADGRVTLPGTAYLAGSALTMDAAVGNAVRFTGLDLKQILPCASTIPARYLGIEPGGTVHATWNPESSRLAIQEVTTQPTASEEA
jgi:N-acetylglucosamine-6-phosphate deacetylase